MIREEDQRFRNLERKIGIFIVTALVGIAVSFVLYGLQKDFFKKTYNLRFTVDRGTGFSKGMSVKLSGFRIGRVTSITLNEQAMVDVFMEIDSKYQNWITTDSSVKLLKEGLVGDNIVEVSVGSTDKPALKHNESILYVKTKALDELADEIAEKVKPVLIEVRDIISYINSPEGDLKKTIRNMEELTRNLDGTRKNADVLLASASGNISNISGKAVVVLDTTNKKIDSLDLNSTLVRVNATLERLDSKVPAILEKVDTTLANLTAVTYETRTAAEKAFPKVPGILSQAEDVMHSTDRLLNSLQNTWLLRDSTMLPAGQHGFIPGGSHE